MDKKIIYTKFSKSRKKEFSIRTTIFVNSQGELKVEKKGDKYSKSNIQKLVKTYNEINKISKEFTVVPAKLIDEYTVEFPFIDGPTLHEKAISAKSKEEFDSVISKYIELLDSIPIEKIQLDKEFEKIFGEIDKEREYLCLKTGVLDFNLGNLIVDSKGKVHFFDYEWYYPFPIPKDFILFRTLFVFQLNTSSRSFYTLNELLKRYLKDNDSIQQYYDWEKFFQKNVVSKRKTHAIYTKSEIDFNISEIMDENKLLHERNKIMEMENKQLHEFRTSILSDVEEYRAFKKGRFWKYLNMYRALKLKIRKNIKFSK